MAFMGYETPVEMPSMGIYNTDLMKMYIAGAKDQYEKGQEEMKDFMKLYGDFYSDIPGATEEYNRLTLGGARDMINQMMAAGIDPYKSPEARAAISRYIASRPTGLLNEMKRSAETAAAYKKALAQAQNDPNFDPEYNRYMIGGDLESWDPRKPWTTSAPYIAPSMESIAKPYMEKFKQSEMLDSDRPGYIKLGTTDKNQQAAIRGTLEMFENTPYGQYKRQQADQIAAQATNPDGTPLTAEQRKALSDQIFKQPVDDYARQFFQPKYEDDWKYQADYKNKLDISKYWKTTGTKKTSTSSSSTQTQGVPSYSHSIYFQGVGSLFNIDPISASQDMVMQNSNIGKTIASREDQMLKQRRTAGGTHPYDFKGVIQDHTVIGDSESNMKLLGVSGLKPRSSTVGTGSNKVILTENQIVLTDEVKKKMKSNYMLVYDNAGYAAKKGGYERAGFAVNKNNATYGTVTDEVVTYLSKNGRIEQRVRVILHDKNNKAIDSAYLPLQRSQKKSEGQSMAARKLYGSTQPTMLDVNRDWAGRVPKDANATQGYMNKSQKDSDVYSEVSDDEEYYEDED